MSEDWPSTEVLKVRAKAANSYLKLLKSIATSGFKFSKGPLTPVHLLYDGDKFVAIQHGSHHRLAALNFLVDNQFQNMLNEVKFINDNTPLVPCDVRLIVNREDLENLITVGNSKQQFSKEDAEAWFDLAINQIHKKSTVAFEFNEASILFDSIKDLLT